MIFFIDMIFFDEEDSLKKHPYPIRIFSIGGLAYYMINKPEESERVREFVGDDWATDVGYISIKKRSGDWLLVCFDHDQVLIENRLTGEILYEKNVDFDFIIKVTVLRAQFNEKEKEEGEQKGRGRT